MKEVGLKSKLEKEIKFKKEENGKEDTEEKTGKKVKERREVWNRTQEPQNGKKKKEKKKENDEITTKRQKVKK